MNPSPCKKRAILCSAIAKGCSQFCFVRGAISRAATVGTAALLPPARPWRMVRPRQFRSACDGGFPQAARPMPPRQCILSCRPPTLEPPSSSSSSSHHFYYRTLRPNVAATAAAAAAAIAIFSRAWVSCVA